MDLHTDKFVVNPVRTGETRLSRAMRLNVELRSSLLHRLNVRRRQWHDLPATTNRQGCHSCTEYRVDNCFSGDSCL